MFNENFINFLNTLFTEVICEPVKINAVEPVGGGSINQTFQITAGINTFFIKVNDKNAFPGMFEKESKGLQLLNSKSDFRVPKPIISGEFEDKSFLLLEYLQADRQGKNFWMSFAEKLAAMHRQSNTHYGLDYDNYIGSLPQSNKQHDNWPEFFIKERLRPVINMASEKGLMNAGLIRKFENLFIQLPSIFPNEPPALLHGDLWSGNYMCVKYDQPCIFDPAVYYGHREMDLAMTLLFGGFSEDLYHHYTETYPLGPGWQERMDICNLYPLMVHVNLFGTSYLTDVQYILKPF